MYWHNSKENHVSFFVCILFIEWFIDFDANILFYVNFSFFLNAIGQNDSITNYLVSIYYRQAQILMLLANTFYQAYILPLFQFCGAIILIGFLYAAIMGGKFLPPVVTLCLYILVLNMSILLWVLVDMGSQPVLKSGKLLQILKHRNCKYTRKFLRSCPKIVFKVGSFHVMDRSRAPNLMRFVLQRTFFLVKSTGSIEPDMVKFWKLGYVNSCTHRTCTLKTRNEVVFYNLLYPFKSFR